MKLPKLRRPLFCLLNVRISPPPAPPPSKTLSSFKIASAGPRVFPPFVTALVIDFVENERVTELSAKSSALAAGISARSRDEVRMIFTITLKSVSL